MSGLELQELPDLSPELPNINANPDLPDLPTSSITDNTKFTTTNITIAIVVVLVIVGVVIFLIVMFASSGSNGCNNHNKPACVGGTLTCSGSSWSCTCAGQTYKGIPCKEPAVPTCVNGSWSCVCGSGSGASVGSDTCQDGNSLYTCTVVPDGTAQNTNAVGTWSCTCGGYPKSSTSNPDCHGGYLQCYTDSNGQKSWECTCEVPTLDKFEKMPTSGPMGAAVKCAHDGWTWECGDISDDKSCPGPGLSCINGKWSCKCPPNSCPTDAKGICELTGSWSCMCNNHSLIDFESKTNYVERLAQVACSPDSGFKAICGKDVADPADLGPDSLAKCKNGKWICKFPMSLNDVLAFFEKIASVGQSKYLGTQEYSVQLNPQKFNDDVRQNWSFPMKLDSFIKQFKTECSSIAESAQTPGAPDIQDTLYKKINVHINNLT